MEFDAFVEQYLGALEGNERFVPVDAEESVNSYLEISVGDVAKFVIEYERKSVVKSVAEGMWVGVSDAEDSESSVNVDMIAD